MTKIFLTIINMSISASWTILALLFLRLLFRKLPKWITLFLWGIVAIRLICPFYMESIVSLLPTAEGIDIEKINIGTSSIHTETSSNVLPSIVTETITTTTSSVDLLRHGISFLTIVWLLGIAVLLIYTIIHYCHTQRKLSTAILLHDNIFQSENVASPFVLGFIKPKIYLPFQMSEQDMNYVLAHEQTHIHRKDHWWKTLGFLLLILHWFNPLLWFSYLLLCKDIEFACDEEVVKTLNQMERAEYSQTILTCSTKSKIYLAYPIGFGDIRIRDRVKFVLNYKKTSSWIVITAFIVSITFAVCFLTNPNTERSSDSSREDMTSQNNMSASSDDENNSEIFKTSENKEIDIDKQNFQNKAKVNDSTILTTIKGEILEINDRYILLKSNNAYLYTIGISDETIVFINNVECDISEIKIGQTITALNQGIIYETYPLKANKIVKIIIE